MEKPNAPPAEVRNIIDDTTLFTLASALYAFIQLMHQLGLDPCTC